MIHRDIKPENLLLDHEVCNYGYSFSIVEIIVIGYVIIHCREG